MMGGIYHKTKEWVENMTPRDLFGYRRTMLGTPANLTGSPLCAPVLNYKAPEKSFATVLPFHKIKIKVENFSLMVVATLYLVEYTA